MPISQIVVLNPDGVVLGAREYSPYQIGRDMRVLGTVRALASDLGVAMPEQPLKAGTVEAPDGNIWMRLVGLTHLLQPGWIELRTGVWGPAS